MQMLERIIAIIKNNIKTGGEVKADTDLRNELGIDSFDALMIMNALDDQYAIALEEDDFKQVNTPLDIVNLLKNKYGINEP